MTDNQDDLPYSINNLSGISKALRLFHIIEKDPSDSFISTAIHFLQQTSLTHFYKSWISSHPTLIHFFSSPLSSWLEQQESQNQHRLSQLLDEKKKAVQSLIAEQLRQSCLDRTRFFLSTGDLESAHVTVLESREFSGNSLTTLDLSLLHALILILLGHFEESLQVLDRSNLILNELNKQSKENIVFESSIFESKILIFRGYAKFMTRNFAEASQIFEKCLANNFEFSEFLSSTDISRYFLFSSLLSSPLSFVRQNVVENSVVQSFLSEESILMGLAELFTSMDLKNFFQILDSEEFLKFMSLEKSLDSVVNILIDNLIKRTLTLYISSFENLKFSELAEIFVSKRLSETDLFKLIENLIENENVGFRLKSITNDYILVRQSNLIDWDVFVDVSGSVNSVIGDCVNSTCRQFVHLLSEKRGSDLT
ncbi:hypothetical protein RCL1_007862 [Eukaryota sp. TZLM3-RCL]